MKLEKVGDEMSDLLVVGKIVNTHGIKGEVRVISSTDFPERRYAPGATLIVKHDHSDEEIAVTVTGHRTHKQFDLLRFEGYHSINDVERFKGATLYVRKDDLDDELGEHEYYYYEIIGCTVVTEEGERLGKVKEIFQTGANDVWVVEREGKKDLLIPYIEDVVKEVNVEKKEIRIHLMEGLDE